MERDSSSTTECIRLLAALQTVSLQLLPSLVYFGLDPQVYDWNLTSALSSPLGLFFCCCLFVSKCICMIVMSLLFFQHTCRFSYTEVEIISRETHCTLCIGLCLARFKHRGLCFLGHKISRLVSGTFLRNALSHPSSFMTLMDSFLREPTERRKEKPLQTR